MYHAKRKRFIIFVGCCLFGEIAIPAAVVGIIIGAMLSTMISGYFMLWSVIGAEIIAALVAVFVSSWFVSSEEEKVDKNREEIRKAILKMKSWKGNTRRSWHYGTKQSIT